MVLDLVSTAAQLRTMRTGLSSLAEEMEPRLESARGAWAEAAAMGADLRERVRRARTSWLVAEPLEPLGAYGLAEVEAYRMAAADGSQIYPDHQELPCYLVNVGRCDIDYRTGSAALDSSPSLHWAPEDLYPLWGGVRQEADARVVGARRFLAECGALEEALAEGAGEPLVAAVDGTLLLWWLEPDPDRLLSLAPEDLKRRVLRGLERFLGAARERGALPCGYLSSPRTTDVVSMLKVVLCTEDPVDCDRCPYEVGEKVWSPRAAGRPLPVLPSPTKPCEEAHPVADAALFEGLLRPGQRSSRFRSTAKVAGAYDAPIDFVYLHAGEEIARVEVPAWVPPDGLDLLCGCLLDQCGKGLGYPVSLAEAHEQAVVKGADRRAFLELVGRQVPLRTRRKSARKRAGVL